MRILRVNNVAWVTCKFIDDRIDSSSYITQINMGLFDLYKKDSNDFQIKTLDDICNKIVDGPFGSEILEKDYVEKGVPFIRVQNITEYGFEDLNLVFISEEANKRIGRSECRPGDLVFTKTGRLGTVCVLNNKYSNYNIRGDLAKLELKSQVDPYYVMSYLNSNFGTKITNSYSSGSTRGRILISNIKKIAIPIPSPEIQKYIGDKVRKAEELREEAKRLKKEAEEIFFNEINIVSIDNAFKKEQHIKFNWINIDELDVNRIDAEYNRRKYTILVKLLIDNNITLIPISNLLEEPIVSGSTPKGGNYIENGIPFVRATNLCEYSIDDNLVYISKEESDKLKNSEIRSGDVVFSIAGSIGVASIIPSYIEKANINQALVRLRLNNINKYYFVFVVNSSIGRLLSLRLANGAVQLNLNREEVGNIMVPRINDNKEEIIANKIKLYIELLYQSKQLIQEAKQDVEDLIEGNFDMSKVKANS